MKEKRSLISPDYGMPVQRQCDLLGLQRSSYYYSAKEPEHDTELMNEIMDIWLELAPKTGRTHQLRVHCAEGLNTPILGDGKYGGKDAFALGRKSLHLHARALVLPLPHGKTMTFEAPLSKDMQETFQELGFEDV